MADFERKYLTVNNKPGAPECTREYVDQLLKKLVTQAPELKESVHLVLAALAIGAHRADFLPHVFASATAHIPPIDNERYGKVYQRFSAVTMVIWPAVGGPWCNSAQLYLAHMLEQRGFHDGAALNTRRQIGPEDEIAAQEFLKNQYSSSADPNLKNLLGVYSSDFDRVVQTVALGYCHVGTTKTGVLKAHETELVLAAAIAGSGATRSAIIHGKAALVAGNSVAALRATYEMAETINKWNNVAFVLVVAEDLATGLSGGR